MAKSKELNPIKKGQATFILVGKAKVSDYTFKLDLESQKEDSDWVYSKMNLAVDCGDKSGNIYCDLQSGYGASRENVVYVHGKKDVDGNEQDDFQNQFKIAWEDRFDQDVLNGLGKKCFITVGLEKDEKDKIVYKNFITPYDAIEYLNKTLKDGQEIKVKGDMKWKEYNGKTQLTKEVTYVGLKGNDDEVGATFVQTILTDKDSIGKADKETMQIPVLGYVLDHVNEYKGQIITKKINGKIKKGTTLPLLKEFQVKIDAEDKEKITKFLKLFKAKPKKVTQITVEGYFTKGEVETTTVSEKDIPDDIKELIELGYIEKEKVLNQMAFVNGNNNKPETMVIKSPKIKCKKGELPSIERISDLYEEDDININLILENFDVASTIVDTTENEESEVDMDKVISDTLDEEVDDDDADWLADL